MPLFIRVLEDLRSGTSSKFHGGDAIWLPELKFRGPVKVQDIYSLFPDEGGFGGEIGGLSFINSPSIYKEYL
ncbi:hypothetical protein AZI86_11635 [Bdellovibrio bacteriovorus]|uniref:Uncharacterized protein n=1 Tax=Bdellovibrio bacteriovorus TaxID=959 RepID=A0A150WM27_BDEBC|nr:hypothetical protein AZI86_11635 [Bdellovibrio bacteriovorus]